MVQATDEAIKKIKQFLDEQQGPRSIRILMTEGGWRGPYLVLETDEQKQNDQVFRQGDVTFLIDKDLLSKAKYVNIDYVNSAMGSGYTLKSDLLKDIVDQCESPICQTCSPHG